MIPFNGLKMCPRCEQKILIGGYLMLPGKTEIEHFCFKCALALAQEDYTAHGGEGTMTVQHLKITDTDDDERAGQ